MEQARDLPIREGAGMDSGSRAGMTALRASVEHGRGPGSDGGQGFEGLGQRARKAWSAAARVCSMSCSVWAPERNHLPCMLALIPPSRSFCRKVT